MMTRMINLHRHDFKNRNTFFIHGIKTFVHIKKMKRNKINEQNKKTTHEIVVFSPNLNNVFVLILDTTHTVALLQFLNTSR